MKDTLPKAGIAAVIALSLAVGGAQAAFADSTLHNSWEGKERGEATWSTSGNHLRVYDQRADGYGIEVEFFYDGHLVYCYNKTGAGTVKTCTYSIPAGTWVQYRIWIMDKGAEIGGSVSGVRDDRA